MIRIDDLPQIKAKLAERAEDVCRKYLPEGRNVGGRWTVGGLDGVRGQSMTVNLSGPRAGQWKDFATNDRGNNLFELVYRATKAPLPDAIREAREFLGMPAPNGQAVTPKASAPVPAPAAPAAFDWPACVDAFTDARLGEVATERGLAVEFVQWLRETSLIGWHNGSVAFPVHAAPGGPVSGCHYRGRVKDSKGKFPWFYTKGTGVRALVIGDPANAEQVHAFESQWDFFAVVSLITDRLPTATAFVVTRGAANGRLAVEGLGIRPGAELFAWKQNDEEKNAQRAGDVWLADVAAAAGREGLTVREVATPAEHADPNDWTRAGATVEDLLAAMPAAVPVAVPVDLQAAPVSPTGDTPAADLFARGLLSAADLDDLAIPTRRALLDRWFCEGDLGFLYAQRGVGKTWLSLLLSRGVSGGDPAGPWKPGAGDPAGVLYVDGEMPLELLQARQRGLGIKGDAVVFLNHEHLFNATGQLLNLSDPAAQADVTRLCLERSVKLLVLDNLSCLFRGVSENDADAWEMVLPWLLELRRLKIAVLIVAHAGRNNAMRGTSRREDAAAWILRLDDATDGAGPKNGAKFVSSFAKPSRNTPENIPPLEWTVTTDAASGRSTVAYKEAEGEEAVLGWVRNGLNTCSEIAEEMNVSRGTVSKMATRLIEAGKLKKGPGRSYAIPMLGDEAEGGADDE